MIMDANASHSEHFGRDSTVEVGIVGAGISGLRSAEILLEHGFKVTILEARDRIGGRVSGINPLVILIRARLTYSRFVKVINWDTLQTCKSLLTIQVNKLM